jgi:hypothetical protein
MFQSWRLQLREAEEAFREGRLDEAEQLLEQGQLRRYLPGKRLSAKVAEQIAQRARQRMLSGESSAGWRDLDAACSLSGGTSEVLSVRAEIVNCVLREAESMITAGEPGKAVSRLESLEKRGVGNQQVRTLKEVAGRLQSARKLCSRGKFADAESQLTSAAALRPDLQAVVDQLETCRSNRQRGRDLAEQLHRALSAENWSETLALADHMLEIVPESPLALDARRRAWLEVGATPPRLDDLEAGQIWMLDDVGNGAERAADGQRPPADGEDQSRFVLWVDGVGGYLVCLGGEVTIGQAVPGTEVEVPIQGDLSRQHARIRRDDGYLIEPLHRVRIDGKDVRETTLLSDGDEIELGEGVRLRFRQPHALSATARLELVSGHRTQPSADGVLLMAESCVMGPKWQNHIICRDWSSDVVLYRREGELFCRALEPIEIDDQYCEGQGKVETNSHVAGSDFSLSLEDLDKCCHKPLL